MIILGIDPGTTQIGYGVIREEKGEFTCIDYGIIKNDGLDKSFDIKNTYKKLGKLITKHNPDVAAIEKIFFFKNQKTVISVSEMRGVILLALARKNILVREFTPLEVKSYISNFGQADKKQIQSMVKLILGLNKNVKSDDAADALAIAICGCFSKRY